MLRERNARKKEKHTHPDRVARSDRMIFDPNTLSSAAQLDRVCVNKATHQRGRVA